VTVLSVLTHPLVAGEFLVLHVVVRLSVGPSVFESKSKQVVIRLEFVVSASYPSLAKKLATKV
jgi:hypothetical protein